MVKKEIVLIGAGKIGRGYIAELFQEGDYTLKFIDYSKELVEAMNSQGYYTINKAYFDGRTEKIRVDGYEALCLQRDYNACVQWLAGVNYASVQVFPGALESIGHLIGHAVQQRIQENNIEPLDIFICVNFLNPTKKFKKYIYEVLQTKEEQAFLEEHVGFIETLVMRTSSDPTEEMKKQDPLALAVAEGEVLPADAEGFKGEVPQDVHIELQDRLGMRLTHKIWHVNMSHFSLAVYGKLFGTSYIWESTTNPYIVQIVEQEMEESDFALAHEFGLSIEEIKKDFNHDDRLWDDYKNQTIQDDIRRVAADPIRKLAREERLVGPAMVCIKNGHTPSALAHAIAAAYLYNAQTDAAAMEIQMFIKENSIWAAMEKYSGLSEKNAADKTLMHMVQSYYEKLKNKEYVLPEGV